MNEWNRGYEKGYADAMEMLTLTDEEIIYLAKQFEGIWDGAVDYKGFARAILRKAQKK